MAVSVALLILSLLGHELKLAVETIYPSLLFIAISFYISWKHRNQNPDAPTNTERVNRGGDEEEEGYESYSLENTAVDNGEEEATTPNAPTNTERVYDEEQGFASVLLENSAGVSEEENTTREGRSVRVEAATTPAISSNEE